MSRASDIEIPDGYRCLEEGEIIRDGDLYLRTDKKNTTWKPVMISNGRPYIKSHWCNDPVIRKKPELSTMALETLCDPLTFSKTPGCMQDAIDAIAQVHQMLNRRQSLFDTRPADSWEGFVSKVRKGEIHEIVQIVLERTR